MKTIIAIILLVFALTYSFPRNNTGSKTNSTDNGNFATITTVMVSASSGNSSGSYTTLKAAFDAINAGIYNGDITVLIYSSTIESATASLNASGVGSASYSSILIYPADYGLSVTGNIAGSLVTLNGADNVTFDGRVNQSGGRNLIIVNSSTSSSAATFTFTSDAQNNLLTYCTFKGATTNSSGGVIYFGSASSSGNDNNKIDNCEVREDAAGMPKNLIYSAGTSAKENSGNIITNCNLCCFNAGTSAAGIYLNSNSLNWTISNNSLFENTAITGTAASTIYGIYIGTGSGHVITGNYIGGSSSLCGGTPWTISGTAATYNFVGIYLNVSSSNPCSVQNNTIKNFSWLSSSAGSYWIGIYVNSGSVNVGTVTGNNIGANTGTGSISLNGAANNGSAIGIYSVSGNTVNISNNTIGSILFPASSYGNIFYGIDINPTNSPGTTTLSNNTIGSTSTANSINNNSGSANYQSVYGIYGMGFSSTGILNITNNTISNLNNYTICPTATNSSLYGLYISNAGTCTMTGNTIRDLYNSSSYVTAENYGTIGAMLGNTQMLTFSQNTIFNISNTNTGNYQTGVAGIFNCGTTNIGTAVISRNRIYGLTNTSTGAGTILGIICLYAGAADFTNNQISLGTGIPGNIGIFGIDVYDAGPSNFYYNSIYIGGSGTGTSYAFYRLVWDDYCITALRNNILYNSRTGGSAYAIANVYMVPTYGFGANASNYNLLIGPVAGKLGRWSGADCTLATWKSNSNCDQNSWYTISTALNATDLFNNPVNGDLTVKANNQAAWYASGKGLPVTACTSDFTSNNVRSSTISAGVTDIGSTELTATQPSINAIITGSHAVNGTETFTFAGRTVGTITWGATGTLPAINYFRYNIGINPGNPTGNYSNGYWEINATGGSGYSYSVTLYYDPSMIGTIGSEANVRIAKSENNSTWTHFDGSVVNTTNKTITVSGLSSFSYFALSDQNSPMPVALAYFNYAAKENTIDLKWATMVELNNSGFDIERKNISKSNNIWNSVAFVKGKGNSNVQNVYKFEDSKLEAGSYKYRLKQVDYNGSFEYYDLEADVVINPPDKFYVKQNYPNPSNPNSRIEFEIPDAGNVTLKVFDMLGKEVAMLVNERKKAGYYLVEFDGSNLASGVYYYKLVSNGFAATKKMILLK